MARIPRTDYPAAINGFNAYKNGSALIGVSGQVTLPTMEAIVASVTGAGILGGIDVPVVGHFNNIPLTIPFVVLNDDIFELLNPGDGVDLTLRGDIQALNQQTGAVTHYGMRVVVRGYLQSFTPGNLQAAAAMDASITLNLSYILIEVNGSQKLEYDKLNWVYRVNGKDALAEIRKNV